MPSPLATPLTAVSSRRQAGRRAHRHSSFVTPPTLRKTLLAMAASAALAPYSAWALDLSQAPPGTVEPYVRPNVILSIDDSGSMGYRLDRESSSGTTNNTKPQNNGTWLSTDKRMNVLKYALRAVFDPTHPDYDASLIPDKKIRIGWQVMWNNGKSSNALSIDSGSGTTGKPLLNTNSIRILESSHRTNLVSFINALSAKSGTPSHLMFKQADQYMRRSLDVNGPWASEPGKTGAPYLGCRRNYHIFMTDGRWNGTVSTGTVNDNHAINVSNAAKKLPDGTIYGSATEAQRPYNKLYHDTVTNTLADWAFNSWANPLQTTVDASSSSTTALKGKPEPDASYRKAPETENFGKDATGKDAILERYWNPKYNPATWPHMVTYTIGFSKMAYTWPGNAAAGMTAPSTPDTVCTTIKAPGQGCTTTTTGSSSNRKTVGTATFDLDAMLPFGYEAGNNGSLPDFITGNLTWPALGSENVRSLDLWHAALNGRGRFYAIERGEDLQKAFRDIFAQINSQTDPDMTSTATSGSNSSRSDVGKYTGNYEPRNDWKGYVTADMVKKDGTTAPDPNWGGKNTADKIDAMTAANRIILSWSDKWNGGTQTGGVPFVWGSLSDDQKGWLNQNAKSPVTTDNKGQDRLNYIRGDRSKESDTETNAKPFRLRQSAQGDIINSVVWYTGAPASSYALRGYSSFTSAQRNRTPMIYVGGNDGMLHGFSAADGTEKMAYVPQGVIPKLRLLTAHDYNTKHQHFVDGSPMTGDVDMAAGTQDPDDPDYTGHTPDWRTLLVGTLGAGGKGYFVLDVTNPGSFSASASAAKTQVILDRTRSSEGALSCTSLNGTNKTACEALALEERDIGNITARPVLDDTNTLRTTQITRLNNNRWAVVLGNGVNSANQRPVLLVQYLDGDKELKRIPATTNAQGSGYADDNGLFAPRLVDINADGRPDVAYAGDNQGNLWKFDLTNLDDSNWKVAFSGSPLFTATGPVGTGTNRDTPQPITVAPTARPNDRTRIAGSGSDAQEVNVGGMMVAFGTGRNITESDPSDVAVQTLYSVLDNTRYRTVETAKGKRLEVHPGGGTCTPIPEPDCAPTPKALGKGVTSAALVQRKFEVVADDASSLDDTNASINWNTHNGWYADLPATGERLLKPLELYDGSNILSMYSQVPAKGGNDVDPDLESCTSVAVDEERQFRTFINIMDGEAPSVQLVDYNGDGLFNAGDKNVIRTKVTKGAHNQIVTGKDAITDIDSKNNKENLARMPEQSFRPTWRQLK